MRLIIGSLLLTSLTFTAYAQPEPSSHACNVDVSGLGKSAYPEVSEVGKELKRINCKTGDRLVLTNIATKVETPNGTARSVNTYYREFICKPGEFSHPMQSDGRNGLVCTFNGKTNF